MIAQRHLHHLLLREELVGVCRATLTLPSTLFSIAQILKP